MDNYFPVPFPLRGVFMNRKALNDVIVKYWRGADSYRHYSADSQVSHRYRQDETRIKKQFRKELIFKSIKKDRVITLAS